MLNARSLDSALHPLFPYASTTLSATLFLDCSVSSSFNHVSSRGKQVLKEFTYVSCT